jgi:hypothetical protein
MYVRGEGVGNRRIGSRKRMRFRGGKVEVFREKRWLV